MTYRTLMLATVSALLGGAAAAAAADSPAFYHLQSVLPLPSTNSSWDHIDYDQAHHRIYMSRRADGLTVVDVATNTIVGQVANAKGSGAVALAPSLDRGFTANTDGSTSIFRLSDLSPVDRISFGDNFDGVVFDAATGILAFQQADNSIELLVDAATGKKLAAVAVEGTQLERPALDGHGSLFLPMRDTSAVYRIDLKAAKITAKWDVSAKCVEPSGADYDAASDRLFLACRGKQTNPLLAVVDAKSGQVTTTLPIGRGADDVVFDAASKTLFVSAGLDPVIMMARQFGPDEYKMVQAFQTRAGARVMRFDSTTRKIYTMTGDGIVDPAKKVLTAISPFYPNTVAPNSFVLLTYGIDAAK